MNIKNGRKIKMSFNKTKDNIVTIIIFTIIISGIVLLAINNGYKKRREEQQKIELQQLKKENIQLKQKLNQIDFFEYKKLKIYKNSDIIIPDNFKENILDTIIYYNKKYKIPDSICYRLIYEESKFNFEAKNKKSGAIGLYQIMPKTFLIYLKKLKINKINQYTQIQIGSYILYETYNQYKKWDLVLSLYNSGKLSLDKNKNFIPYNCKETANFINKILNKNGR